MSETENKHSRKIPIEHKAHLETLILRKPLMQNTMSLMNTIKKIKNKPIEDCGKNYLLFSQP